MACQIEISSGSCSYTSFLKRRNAPLPCSDSLRRWPAAQSLMPLGVVDHVLIPRVQREGIDDDEVQLVDLDGILPVDARISGLEDDRTRSRIEHPSVVVVGLVRRRGGDLLNVDAVQVEHAVSPKPCAWARKRHSCKILRTFSYATAAPVGSCRSVGWSVA